MAGCLNTSDGSVVEISDGTGGTLRLRLDDAQVELTPSEAVELAALLLEAYRRKRPGPSSE